MVKVNGKKVKIMLLLAVIAAVAVGFFRVFLLVNYIEPETGFYIQGTSLGGIFNVALVALVVMIAAFGLLLRKTPSPEHLDSKSTVVVFTSALCAFMYFSLFFYGIYKTVSLQNELNYFLIAEIVLCVPCCLNHISVCSTEVREKNTPHALFAMSEAVFFGVRVIEVFMDTKSQINVSQRSLELIMLCAMMIFFLLEAQFLVNCQEEKGKSLSKYFMAAVATAVLPIIVVLPYLAVSLFWCFEANFVVMDVIECCVMLFAASRLLTLRFE